MRIERATNPDRDYACGIVVPWFRAIGHLAFAAAELNNTEELTDELKANIKEDITEAGRHLLDLTSEPTAFLNEATINESNNLRSVITEYADLVLEDTERNDILINLQNIMHNAATLVSRAERDLFGISASPGRLL